MSLDECVGDLDRRVEAKGRSHSMLVFDDIMRKNQWVFRFRGRNRGQTGGAVVVVQGSMDEPILTAGVSICTPLDRWNPTKGIKIAVARLHTPGQKGRSNPWRFTTVLTPIGANESGEDVYRDPEHSYIYSFAKKCLHRTFLIHNFSTETCTWFTERFPWLEREELINFPATITTG